LKLHPKRSGRGSIFIKLLSGYLAVTLVIILLTGVVSYALLQNYLINSNKRDLLDKAETLAKMAQRPGGYSRVLDLPRIGEIQTLTDAQVIYIDSTMQARQVPDWRRPDLFNKGEPQDFQILDVIDSLDQQLLKSLLDGNTAVDVRKLDFMQDQMVFAGAPIKDSDGATKGALLLCRPLREVSVANQNLIKLMAIAFLIAGLIASAIAYLFSRRLTRPLTALNRTATRMAEGFYGERVGITQNDEIGQLGTTLNLLSGRLSTVINTLNEEKSKLEKVLTSIGEGIIAVDRQGRVVHHNQAALSLLALPPRTEESQSIKQQLTEMLQRASDGDERVMSRFKVRDRIIEAVASPIHNEGDGTTIGAVCLLRDISESERLEQMRRDYIANVSHELRTPLTGIRGMAEPLLDGYIETEQERQECYRVIYQESLRLEKLIGEMLDLSRLQEGRIKLELEPMEPEGLLEAANRRMKARAAEGQVELAVEAEPGLMVMGDEDRILQVLIILMDNALSFTPPGGSVTLSAHRAPGKKVVLGVKDTGAGIDPGDLPYIWERFYKADKSRMRTSGTGLGLSIAKLVVGLMGGTISVDTKLGEGSAFTFTLDEAEMPDGETLRTPVLGS
jgi:two-component system sensor histidine kinase ResE